MLEKGKKKARCEKELAANYIIEAFDSIQGIIKYNERTNKIIKLQKYIKKHLCQRPAFAALALCIKFELGFETYRTEQRRGIEKDATEKICEVIIAVSIQNSLTKGHKARILLGSNLLKITGKKKVHKVVVATNIV